MSSLLILAIVVLATAGAVALAFRRLDAMSSSEKKSFFKLTLNGVFTWCEDRGLLERTPAFDYDYSKTYPKLTIFEDHYEDIRAECLELLKSRERLTDMSSLGGAYTQAGIHTISWKSFMFKAGDFVEENCRRCPKTAALLAEVPEVFMAFFSIVDPRQHISPHWGYYKGFVRYHLGVVIPDDNENGLCWVRVNGDKHDNEQRDPSLVEKGEVYHWKNGEGIVFDDNYLHDAANESDEVRVIMWLDVRRKMPFYLDIYNRVCLALVKRDKSIKKIQRNAIVAD
jgi:aspartyl/asparaginyl beta-hydroxylase (cupin superfamily)